MHFTMTGTSPAPAGMQAAHTPARRPQAAPAVPRRQAARATPPPAVRRHACRCSAQRLARLPCRPRSAGSSGDGAPAVLLEAIAAVERAEVLQDRALQLARAAEEAATEAELAATLADSKRTEARRAALEGAPGLSSGDLPPAEKAERANRLLALSEEAMAAANDAESALIRAQEAQLAADEATVETEAAAIEAEAALLRASALEQQE